MRYTEITKTQILPKQEGDRTAQLRGTGPRYALHLCWTWHCSKLRAKVDLSEPHGSDVGRLLHECQKRSRTSELSRGRPPGADAAAHCGGQLRQQFSPRAVARRYVSFPWQSYAATTTASRICRLILPTQGATSEAEAAASGRPQLCRAPAASISHSDGRKAAARCGPSEGQTSEKSVLIHK